MVWQSFLAGLVLAGFGNAVPRDIEKRSSLILPAPPWRGSAVIPPSVIYETPTATPSWDDDGDDEYSTPKPDPYSDETWSPYPLPTAAEPSTTPHPSYSAIVSVRTTTWVISRSTTITSVILETYYSTLTEYSGSAESGSGTVTVTTSVTETESESAPSASDPCAAAASGSPSKYASECSLSGGPVTTITWTPALTAYSLPPSSEDEGRAPASTSTTSSAAPSTTTATSTSTTTATETSTESPTGTSTANESPPVVTGAAAPLHSTNTRVLAAAAALFAVLA
ncbi:hypothetical protein A9Z42_0055780 [Trichoderma parareesei]|uniref:Uncharacterized protein n=1 Tax=Trichoderma parareesei TaxID=858221 RepID=A0A2H3A0U7_TRIPA|nr:hypothetical protein A9Z42_0055780 [Trichoderma parareesei]